MISVLPTRGFPLNWGAGVVVLAASGLVLTSGGPGLAQVKTPRAPKLPANLVIYRGDSLQTSGLTLSSWGSGSIDKDTGKVFSGTESLKITTHGMYQGASLVFTKPVNLSALLANKNNYLTIALLPPPANTSGGATGGPEGGFAGFSGGKQGQLGGGAPGLSGGNPGSFSGFTSGGPGGYQGAGAKGGGQIQTQKNRKLENLRMVIVTTGDKTLEVMLPLANASEENQWKILSVPLSVIPGLTADDAQIKEIRLFGDAPATLNVGSIGVVEDPTPITLDTINDKTVQRLLRYQYVATANAGVTPLVFSWDWDATDGIQDETQGHNVTHTFRKASADDAGKNTDFVVTVTVSDLYNIKSPVKTTFKVHVTP